MHFSFTEIEKEEVLKRYFISENPLILKTFPAKEKKKYLTLLFIKDIFENDVIYNEQEINALIRPIYEDFVTIRRYLVDYRFLKREKDGSKYYKIVEKEGV